MQPGSPSPDRPPTPNDDQPSRWGERGTVTLEALVVYPLVLLIAWIGMQLALVHLANRVALASAEEAATTAHQRAHHYLDMLGTGLPTGATVQIVRTPDTVTVQVSGHAQRIVPGFPVQVTQSVQSPTERFHAVSRGFGDSEGLSAARSRVVGADG